MKWAYAVLKAAQAFRRASAELRDHIAQRKDATSLPDRAFRAKRVELTERVATARIALHTATLEP